MPYTVHYLVNSRETGSEEWDGFLFLAHAHARQSVAKGVADRVEIRNQAGSLVFQHPRVLSRAR